MKPPYSSSSTEPLPAARQNLRSKITNFLDVVGGFMMRRPLSPFQAKQDRYEEARHRRLLATLDCACVKSVVSEDGQERVRIIQDRGNFGAVVDMLISEGPCSQWTPSRMVGAGCIFDCADAAETEAEGTLSWLKSKNRHKP